MAVQSTDLTKLRKALGRLNPVRVSGRVVQVVGLTIEVIGLNCQIGEICEIHNKDEQILLAEVIGFRENRMLLMPLGEMEGIQPDSPVYPAARSFQAPVGTALLGRVLDGLGRPIDGRPLDIQEWSSTSRNAPHPLQRPPITEPLVTGVRVIDGMLTCGKGQRLGIFAGSGVGKSTLMGSIARNSFSDISVIALIGERGREVREFLERDLGPKGLERSVVVVSTSDQPALVRLKAALVAMTIAENFRESGMDVTFLMDSVTRFAMAQREIGLSIGEPPASKGYTPSVFAMLPKLLERAGTSAKGSITGFFTVLVAARNHYPAIDVLGSVSRVMPAITSQDHRRIAATSRKHLATYEKARDLVNIGAYVHGSDPEIDSALAVMSKINGFLQQGVDEVSDFDETFAGLQMIDTHKAVDNKGKER
jgi:FliI/YscN family ATPase